MQQSVISRSFGKLRTLFHHPSILYVAFLIGVAFLLFLQYPIRYADTDLWIHLSDGKYFFEHHAIPNSSFFSFLDPPRESINYRWLFQVLVYFIYTKGGYLGLIVFRALVYLGVCVLVASFLFKDQKQKGVHGWLASLAVLYCLVLIYRYLNVRPHILTYSLIVAFLFILELKPHRAICLLPLSVLWCNLHGVTYPIMLLICGAYVSEYVIGRVLGKSHDDKNVYSFLIPTVLSMCAIYLTPHGVRLLEVPFYSLGHLSQYIGELQSVPLKSFSFVAFPYFIPTFQTLFALLTIIILMASIVTCTKRASFRISHVILLIGGFIAHLIYGRGRYEFFLLSLPLLRANPLHSCAQRPMEIPRLVWWVLAGFIMLSPLRFLDRVLVSRMAYPFSKTGLPHGVTTFLKHTRATGEVFNFMNTGGYWRWMAYPNNTIWMDVDWLFNKEDFYVTLSAFRNKETLRRVLQRYDPSFISVPLRVVGFKDVIAAFPSYVPVFFDDAEVLYVNRAHYPLMAEQYELLSLDPFLLANEGVEAVIAKEPLDDIVKEVRRLLQVYPEGLLTHYLMGVILNQEGSYDRVLPHAAEIIRNFPEFPEGYMLRGDAYKGLRAFPLAVANYKMALSRIKGIERDEQGEMPRKQQVLYQKIGLTFWEQRNYPKAYRALTKSTHVVSSMTSDEDLYRFGLAALLIGKLEEARDMFVYLNDYRIPAENTELRAKVQLILSHIKAQ